MLSEEDEFVGDLADTESDMLMIGESSLPPAETRASGVERCGPRSRWATRDAGAGRSTAGTRLGLRRTSVSPAAHGN